MAQLEAREYPWSSLGRLNVAGRHFCNGVMVGKNNLLAPASCLYDLVEGRWFQPKEMVFVAGYQRDDSTIFSTADSYQIARGFVPQNKSLKSLLNNWALIRLSLPLGDHTGWVGVRNSVTTQDLTMMAGYRRGWEHVQALFPLCNQSDVQKNKCPQRSDGPLNRYIIEENGLSLAPNHPISPQTFALWNLPASPQSPRKFQYVSPLPQNSVTRLLVDLGYLESPSSEIKSSTRAAQYELGFEQTGQANISTLYLLLRELNRVRNGRPVS
ncbi:trypsin-like serine peptidase [Kiloniella sp.]|uniref:trypsin-like serine peptidase n=1 Tax=Kiloniella sp. TaxID=1938587 RepID=UPI003B0225C6